MEDHSADVYVLVAYLDDVFMFIFYVHALCSINLNECDYTFFIGDPVLPPLPLQLTPDTFNIAAAFIELQPGDLSSTGNPI